MKSPRIAFFYDKIIKYGGAERVIQAIHEIWPQSPFYTSIYTSKTTSWASGIYIKASYLKYLSFLDKFSWAYSFLSPKSVESFNFEEYDAVVALTSSYGIRLKTTGIPFILYHLTPTRYLWSGYFDYLDEPGFGVFNPLVTLIFKVLAPFMRWQEIHFLKKSATNIAISEEVYKRVLKYYRRISKIIYPPVDTEIFCVNPTVRSGNYFLIVSRLVPYKKIDYAIDAFNEMKLPLIIIGDGIDLNRLKKKAGATIQFHTTRLTDQELAWYYQGSLALIFPGLEDFGIAPLEAQACGKPVIGLSRGGLKETVKDGVTGELYDISHKSALISKVREFYTKKYSVSACRNNALRFSKEKFKLEFKGIIEKSLTKI
jgi:glycosyltransferase involved in cell wall biosynthesis